MEVPALVVRVVPAPLVLVGEAVPPKVEVAGHEALAARPGAGCEFVDGAAAVGAVFGAGFEPLGWWVSRQG